MPVSEKKKASNKKWNAAHMTALSIRVPYTQANAFRAVCKAQGISQHSVLKSAIVHTIEQYKAEHGGALPESDQEQTADTPNE